MANEAVIIELLGNGGDPVRYTCASGTKIAKGTILELTDPRTVAANNGVDKVAGIAAHDKAADDYSTTISAYTNGIFDLTGAGGATITAGSMVRTSGANVIVDAAAGDAEAGQVLGRALETKAAATAEVVAVRVLV